MLNLNLPWWSAMPFLTFVCGIALLPGLLKNKWHSFENVFCLIMGFSSIIIVFYFFGRSNAIHEIFEVLFHEYVPFITLIASLYIISSGVFINISGKPSYIQNSLFLFLGSLISSLIGTTGASMLLIRPFIKLNGLRVKKAYLIVFFIITISNIGGSLTPVGDPPLFMGFLNGVSFSWTIINLIEPFIISSFVIILFFIICEKVIGKQESSIKSYEKIHFTISGKQNLLIIGFLPFVLIACEKLSYLNDYFGFPINNIIRIFALIFMTILSYKTTNKKIYENNHFCSGPLKEVSKVFIVIFLSLIPVIYMLKTQTGIFKELIGFISPDGVHNPLRYFWSTGLFSAFLDNAPTYLVFFHASGGDSNALMGPMKSILMAISLGSVYMGAITYIGNAPNLMVKSIAQQKGIHMPSFVEYLVSSFLILFPVFIILSYIYF